MEYTKVLVRNERKRAAAILGVLVLIIGGLASSFYGYYQDAESQKAQLADSLQEARQTIADLKEQFPKPEEEEEEEETEVVAAVASKSVMTVPFPVNLEDWNYILVNELHPLSRDFVPQVEKTYDGQRVDTRIRAALEKMIDDAKAEGLNLLICSSYRDYRKQDSLMDKSIARYINRGMTYTEAFFKTKEQIALTGASEHHTGLAVDIVGKNHQTLDQAQADTAEAIWLNEHAAEYGFILRYPKDKEEITMISFESWHFRYVGEDAAAFMKEKNLCLEEFVELVQKQQEAGENWQASAAQ